MTEATGTVAATSAVDTQGMGYLNTLPRRVVTVYVPLVIFLILSIVAHIGADYETIRAYLAQPVVAIAMLALVISAAIHMRIGLKEIIEDYVHGEGAKVVAILLATFFAAAVGLACTFALVKISLGS